MRGMESMFGNAEMNNMFGAGSSKANMKLTAKKEPYRTAGLRVLKKHTKNVLVAGLKWAPAPKDTSEKDGVPPNFDKTTLKKDEAMKEKIAEDTLKDLHPSSQIKAMEKIITKSANGWLFDTLMKRQEKMNIYGTDADVERVPTPPSPAPTEASSDAKTDSPTPAPADAPTDAPTEAPTSAKTDSPTPAPADAPTPEPAPSPSWWPTGPSVFDSFFGTDDEPKPAPKDTKAKEEKKTAGEDSREGSGEGDVKISPEQAAKIATEKKKKEEARKKREEEKRIAEEKKKADDLIGGFFRPRKGVLDEISDDEDIDLDAEDHVGEKIVKEEL